MLIAVWLVPVAFTLAMLLRSPDDNSVGPNFAVLGMLAFFVASIATIVCWRRQRRAPWIWIGAAISCLVVVVVGLGAVDFGAFGGGKH